MKNEYLEKAIIIYEDVLKKRSKDSHPVDWADTHHNLGNCFSDRKLGEPQENLKKATYHYEQALTVRRFENNPVKRIETLSQYGLLYFQYQKWQEALDKLQEAISFNEQYWLNAHTDMGKTHLLSWTTQLFSYSGYCLIRLGSPEDAFRTLENGKQRLFRQSKLSNKEIRSLLDLIPEKATIIAPLISPYDTEVFIIPHGTKTITQNNILTIEGFTGEYLWDLIFRNKDSWFSNYEQLQDKIGESERMKKRLSNIDTIAHKLWVKLIYHIHNYLKNLSDITEAIIIPAGGLQLLPLHAAWYMNDKQKSYFSDHTLIRYIPSISQLQNLKIEEAEIQPDNSLVVGIGDYANQEELPNLLHIYQEANIVGHFLKTEPLIDRKAQLATISKVAERANYLHFACHGAFAWGGGAFDTALFLVENERLMLSDIINGKFKIKAPSLVTLSACETGIIDIIHPPDEFIGLPAAFLHAGAKGVLSSLWTVNDRSTKLFVEFFYYFHKIENMEPARALQESQKCMRFRNKREKIKKYYMALIADGNDLAYQSFLDISSAPEYAHPYFWAGFLLYGF